MSASNPLTKILDTHRLTGPNFKDWLRNYRIVLGSEKLTHVLDQDPPTIPARPTAEQRAALEKWTDDDNKARYYMLGAMSDDLQRQHENIMTTRQMLAHLQELFGEQSRAAKYQVCQRLFKTKLRDGQSVQDHCLNMIKDLEELEKLGVILDRDFQIDVILQSLSDAFGQFTMNFHMHKMQCTLAELLNMLVTAELSLKGSKDSVLAVERASSKRKSSGKKKKSAKKQKVDGKKKKTEPKKKAAEKGKCFHCNSDGHWKRNCPQYLATLKNKKEGPSGGMLVIESNLTVSSASSWVLDSGSSAHLCTSMQGLEESRRLRDGEMILRVGNGARVAAVAVGTYPLRLPLGLDLVLRDCYYVPAASRNLISVSCLAQEGYVISFHKNHCNIFYENNKVANGFLINGLYQLHIDVSVFNIEQNVNTLVRNS